MVGILAVISEQFLWNSLKNSILLRSLDTQLRTMHKIMIWPWKQSQRAYWQHDRFSIMFLLVDFVALAISSILLSKPSYLELKQRRILILPVLMTEQLQNCIISSTILELHRNAVNYMLVNKQLHFICPLILWL